MFARFSAGPLINDISQVSEDPIAEEAIVPVTSARVVCANYRAIVHDFPQIFGEQALEERPLPGCPDCSRAKRPCRRSIDQWLLRNAAWVSQQQTIPNVVNSPISTGVEVATGYRPASYGRALVVPVDVAAKEGQAGFLDLKGVGLAPGRVPSHEPYSTGLEYLGQAIADFFYSWLVDSIFARTCPGYHIVPVYAVLDYGFDIVGGWHGTGPAGVHVRRAHSRHATKVSLPLAGADRERLMLHAEFLLRLYGLTTAGLYFAYGEGEHADTLLFAGEPVVAHNEAERAMERRIRNIIAETGGEGLEALNMQLTSDESWADKSLQMFDFGHVRAVRRFSNAISNPIRNGALSVGRIVLPTDANFVQPHPTLALDVELCSRRSVNAYGFYAAQAFRVGDKGIDQREIETMLRIARIKAFKRSIDWASQKIDSAQNGSVRRRVPDVCSI